MAKPKTRPGNHRRKPAVLGASPDDLFDYLQSPRRHIGRPVKHAVETWRVTDDWPERAPIKEAEVDVYEAWFGDFFDRIFGPCR